MPLNDFQILPEFRGHETFARVPATWVDRLLLVADTSKEYVIPTGARFLIITGDEDFHCRPGSAVPSLAGNITDGTSGDLNPTIYAVEDVDGNAQMTSLFFRAVATPTITIAAYK